MTKIALTHDLVTLEVSPKGVAIVRYDVPGEPVNTLRSNTAAALDEVLDKIESDASIKAAVILSGKADSFIAGADIEMLKATKTAKEAEDVARGAQAGFVRLSKLRKPVVAAINGAALGGGFELALACHGRVASDDPKTVFALPEVQLGLLPGADGLQRIAQKTDLQTALDLGLTGKNVRPAKAKKLGLVDDVVPKSILLEVAQELALALADGKPPRAKKGGVNAKSIQKAALEGNPLGLKILFQKAREATRAKTKGHYPATEKIIDVLDVFAHKGFAASQDVVAQGFGELVVSETAARLIEIFFATTALKKDTGTSDKSVKAREVKKVAMLGAGLMGAGIAYVTTNAGIAVRLKDKDDDGLTKGVKYVADIYADRAKKGQLTKVEVAKKLALLTGTTDYSGIGNADVVIEAVFEDLGLKHRVVKEVEAVVHPNTIFASNTSSIPITQIAEASVRPENVVGMHYFSPVHKMPLLEIIATKHTSPEVIATAVSLGKKQGKTVIVVNDGYGFYTSRILGPYMNEAAYLLADGVPIDEIDKAMVAWGFPVGPMALLDEVGIDVAAHVGPIMQKAFGDRLAPPGATVKLTADGRKGRKNERGLYLYGAAVKAAESKNPFAKKVRKPVDESVYALIGVMPRPGKVAVEEIQMRCALQFVNEALHCWGEGILRSVRDGDIGAIFGLGFPPFRGGPFRYVDSVGPAEILRRIRAYEDRFGKRWAPAPALVALVQKGEKLYA